MKRKIVWLVVSGLMVLSLLAAACAPKVEEVAPVAPVAPAAPAAPTAPTAPATPAAPAKEMVKLTLTKLDGTKIEKLVEKPKYGGTLRFFGTGAFFTGFDPMLIGQSIVMGGRLYLNKLAVGDWTRSSAGTGETKFESFFTLQSFMRGALAERWELVDKETIVYHLRKGVKFQDKPPRGSWSGREVTAGDVAFSIKTAYASRTSSAFLETPSPFHPVSVEARDKYTVVVKSPPGKKVMATHEQLSAAVYIVPKEFYEQYKNMTDWRNVQGTGAFILKDFVAASVAVFERNPNYWQMDPLFPENQLPYVDKVEWFSIPDKSTYTAALRTGKVDRGDILTYEDLQGLLKTRPDMPYVTQRSQIGSKVMGFNMNKTDGTPITGHIFNDVRVRRALSMAIDRESIIRDFFDGYADNLHYPVLPLDEWKALDFYIPLEKQPPLVQEILSYNPTKAKQLLAEAGYPKGFKTTIDFDVSDADYMSVIKEYFAAIGVDMELRPRDPTVFQTMEVGRTIPNIFITSSGSSATNPFIFSGSKWPPGRMNRGNINDPYINQIAEDIGEFVDDERARIKFYKEKIYSYMLEQVYHIVVPMPNKFVVRQPWLRNNDAGETTIGIYEFTSWPKYVWIDQELKKSLGY